jgi:hypothetical protein
MGGVGRGAHSFKHRERLQLHGLLFLARLLSKGDIPGSSIALAFGVEKIEEFIVFKPGCAV